MERLQLLLLLTMIFPGCQPQREKSVFAGWQPPPVQQKVVVVQSDAVVPPGQKRPVISFPMPVPSNPEVVSEPRVSVIVVSIADQRLFAYGSDKEAPLASFDCSTAISGTTYPLGYGGKEADVHNHSGEFTIDRKDIDHISGQYNCPMPYALHYFEGHWIHATEPKFYHDLGAPASHGCVRLDLNDAKWLYSHTSIGCKLTIR